MVENSVNDSELACLSSDCAFRRLQISALVVVSMASAKIDQRVSYDKYFVGSGDDYDNMRESGRLQRLALILGISGYWTYIAVVITGAIGLFVGSKFSSSKCLTVTWLLTAVVSLLCFLLFCLCQFLRKLCCSIIVALSWTCIH